MKRSNEQSLKNKVNDALMTIKTDDFQRRNEKDFESGRFQGTALLGNSETLD